MKRRLISNIALSVLALSMGPGAIGCGGRTREPGTGERFSCARGDISCDEPVIVADLKAELAIDPPNVAFGNVQVGTEATQVVLLRNIGDALLVLEGASRGQNFDDAFTFNLNRMSIPPQSAAQLAVSFVSESLGDKLASIILRSNDANVPDAEIQISGTGVTTNLVLDPESVSFGNVAINSTKSLSISLFNDSNIDANIELLEGQNVRRCISGTNDPSVFCLLLADRNIGPDGRFSLRAGESTTLEVQFSPVIAGTRERGNFALRACDNSACETEVRLDGLGI